MLKTNFYKEYSNCYSYNYNEFDDFNIWLFYNFLDDLVSKNAYWFLLDNLKDKNSKGLTGNCSDLTLFQDKGIIIDLFDDEKRSITLERSHLIELVKKWRELCEKGVPIITIKRDGETFIIEEGKEE